MILSSLLETLRRPANTSRRTVPRSARDRRRRVGAHLKSQIELLDERILLTAFTETQELLVSEADPTEEFAPDDSSSQLFEANVLTASANGVEAAVGERFDLDIDGDGQKNPFQDAVLLFAWMSPGTPDSVFQSFIGSNATRNTPALVKQHLDSNAALFDIDQNGNTNPFQDAVFVFGWMSPGTPDSVLQSFVASNASASRDTVQEVRDYLDGLGAVTPVAASVASISPTNGESQVSLTRETIVHFTEPVDPSTVSTDSVYLIAKGARIPGTIRVSPTEKFATFFYDTALPESTEVRVVVDGERIVGRDGLKLDADNDGTAGGMATADFRTLPLTLIPGTRVFGYIYDSYNKNPNGSDLPVVGATVFMDANPNIRAVTDANGFFELGLQDVNSDGDPDGLPAPEFFVHIDGSTAINAPAGAKYATLGKPFHSVPGRRVQLRMDGALVDADPLTPGDQFNIYLPPMAMGDIVTLSPTSDTNVGFGPSVLNDARMAELFPNLTAAQRALLSEMKVTYPAGSAMSEDGTMATQGMVIPVNPQRLPAPLPPGMNPGLVISIQAGTAAGFNLAGGSTNFDVPAPVTFPNLDGMAPGEKSLIWSFDHDAGKWVVVGTGTVSDDGRMIVSDAGVGIIAPGWHFVNPGDCAGSGGMPPMPPRESTPNVLEPEVIFITGETGSIPQIDFSADPSPTPTPPPEGCDPPEHNSENRKKTITITVDGNLGKFVKKTGSLELSTRTIVLPDGSGKQESFGGDAQTYSAMFSSLGGFTKLNRDQLYGATVTIKEQDEQTDGSTTTTIRTLLIYRWIDVVDANEAQNKTGSTAAFYRTNTDGVVREKRIDTFLPRSAQTMFDATNSEFTFGQPSGSGATWQFDPSTAGAKSVPVKIKADITVEGQSYSKEIGVLTATGTATAPTTIAINIAGFQAELANVIRSLTAVNGGDSTPGRANIDDDGNGMIDDSNELGWAGSDDIVSYAFSNGATKLAGINFRTLVQAVYPWRNPSPASLNTFLSAQGSALLAAVQADYAGVGGYNILPGSSGDVTMTWTDTFDSQGDASFGGASFDRDDSALRPLLSPSMSQIGDASKQWAIAQYSNLSVTNSGSFGVAINMSWTSGITFSQYVANTVSHEIGHTFGLNDSYDDNGKRYAPLDIMMNGNDSDPDLSFANDNNLLLQAAIGTQPNGDAPISSAAKLVVDIFNLPTLPPALPRDHTTAISDQPDIRVTRGNLEFFGRESDIDSIGTVLVDGHGGAFATMVYTLENAGSRPLQISDIRLTDGAHGFEVQNVPADGTTLQPAESLEFLVIYDPESTGRFGDTLIIESNANLSPHFNLALMSEAVPNAALARLAAVSNNLGGVRPNFVLNNENVASIMNEGGKPLIISNIRLIEGSESFEITGIPSDLNLNPLQLGPNESISFGARFKPIGTGLYRGIVEVQTNDPQSPQLQFTVVGTGLQDVVYPEWGNDHVVVTVGEAANVAVQRTVSSTTGNFSFVLPPIQTYNVSLFDPVTGLIAIARGTTGPSGRGVDLTADTLFEASVANDSDFDGLPDDIEFAVGTGTSNTDSDGDGLDDFTELSQGLNPLDGFSFPTGVISSFTLSGPAMAIAVVNDFIYVATGDRGVAIVDGSEFDDPILLGQIDLPGNSTDVAVDLARSIAAVATGTSLELVDVSDPMVPQVTQSIALNATRVEIANGLAYASAENFIRVFDLSTGTVVQTLFLGVSGNVTGMAREGNMLYAVINGSNTLFTIDISLEGQAAIRGQLDISFVSSDVGIFAGNDVVWLTGGGLQTVNVSDPAAPVLISGRDTLFQSRRVALNGSGLAVVAPEGGTSLEVYSSADPATTDNFVTRHRLSGTARDVAISRGIAYVAAGDRLEVVNYRDFDTLGIAPSSVTLNVDVVDAAPDTPGIQVIEGSPLALTAAVVDDVQVRSVEWLINGQVVETDVAFPFDLTTEAPTVAVGGSSLTVQARAVDTGGNATLSAIQTFTVVPDTFAPTIESVDPADGSSRFEGQRFVRIRFSEAIAENSLSANNFRLAGAGPNGTFGDADDLVIAADLQLRDRDRLVQLTMPSPGLLPGVYRLQINQPAVTDRAGNALGQSVRTETFTVVEFDQSAEFLPFGTDVSLRQDDSSFAISPMPFAFDFFGEAVSGQMFVTTNGVIEFGGDTIGSDYSNDGLPTPNAKVVLPFWDDIDPRQSGTIGLYDADGVRVITFLDIPYYDNRPQKVSFQVAFFSNGQIQMRYGRMDPLQRGNATIGISNGTKIAVPALGKIENAPELEITTTDGLLSQAGLDALTAGDQNDLLVFTPDGTGQYTIVRNPGRTAVSAASLVRLPVESAIDDLFSEELLSVL